LAVFFKALEKGPAVWAEQRAAAGGETFHTAKVKYVPDLIVGGRRVLGVTNSYGDMEISLAQPMGERFITSLHEQVHSFLSPKFFLFRDARAALRDWGYQNVLLLRYLEEAIAETCGQCRAADGVNLERILIGVTFPYRGGYVRISRADVAILGGCALIGYIMVRGTRFGVYQSAN
jgi:hypothetical protein